MFSRVLKRSSNKNFSRSLHRPKLYDTHIPTTSFQKGLLTIGSAILSLNNPERGDMVATLGETTGSCSLQWMLGKMQSDPVGRLILQQKPRITTKTVNPDWLKTLPNGSFGREYYNFMSTRGFVSDERPTVRFVDSEDLAYVMTRYREVHDFWHVLSGLGTTEMEEIALKLLEFTQTGLPMNAMSFLFGPLRLSMNEKRILMQDYLPWVLRTSRSIPYLINIYYENHLEDPLDSLRRNWGFLEPIPRVHK
eukprot:TRINITY_DN5271_c0_g1_i4.p1 TRINITY_DN5271_c0_g1~~TRINITY_DN5271_c0_g1_i4.p1  ORF type:complete len:250 (+),score=1.38 TRINITY_DN5271_c0_g1_i4:20-769(+)